MNITDRISQQLTRQIELRDFVSIMNEKEERQERQRHIGRLQKRAILGFSVAACLTIILYLAPWGELDVSPLIDIERPTLADYRSASISSVEIDEAIENEEYERALELIDQALATSVKDLDRSAEFGRIEDEALLYERELEELNNYQLRWMRIYALVKLSRIDEATTDLESFSMMEGIHQEEAQILLKKISN